MGSKRLDLLFRIITELSAKYPLTQLFHISGLVRSSYYKWRNRAKSSKAASDRKLQTILQEIHRKYPIYGYRRMVTELRKRGICVNHKRVYRLMAQLGIRATIRKKRKHFGRKGSNIFPNLLERNFATTQKLHKLATDITYLPTKTGFLYLSAIQDLHNNEIVSYQLSRRNNLSLVVKTVKQLKSK